MRWINMLFGIVHVGAVLAHKTVYGDRRGIIAANSHYLILDVTSYLPLKRRFRAKNGHGTASRPEVARGD